MKKNKNKKMKYLLILSLKKLKEKERREKAARELWFQKPKQDTSTTSEAIQQVLKDNAIELGISQKNTLKELNKMNIKQKEIQSYKQSLTGNIFFLTD